MSRYPRLRDPRTGRQYLVHRAIAEWTLGRPLAPGEVVHHRSGDREDGHPANLEVLPSQRAHMLLHHYVWREARGVVHLWDLSTWLELHGCGLEPKSPQGWR